MPDEKPTLNAAYDLKSPDDSRRLYGDWADTYDDGFAQAQGYRLPRMVALIFAEAAIGMGPVLDVGAGTGLLAQNIPMRAALEIDGIDISPAMLAQAQAKGIYRKLFEADLTKSLDIADGTYGAIVSSGTFTHGHVGPDALDELLRIARSGAVFVLAINATHFEARGFAAKFAAIAPQIHDVQHREVRIYDDTADAPHRDDTASIAIFHKN